MVLLYFNLINLFCPSVGERLNPDKSPVAVFVKPVCMKIFADDVKWTLIHFAPLYRAPRWNIVVKHASIPQNIRHAIGKRLRYCCETHRAIGERASIRGKIAPNKGIADILRRGDKPCGNSLAMCQFSKMPFKPHRKRRAAYLRLEHSVCIGIALAYMNLLAKALQQNSHLVGIHAKNNDSVFPVLV